jgi:2-phosphosulfolactate phosphatase
MNFNQADFEVRCEWGEKGVLELTPISDVVIIIDVLSFSTCIDIANSRGAIIFPYQWKDESVQVFARSVDAEIAEKRGSSRYSLSPTSLLDINTGTRLVLPSPNGSALSLATQGIPTLAGCLRNCRSVALAAMNYGQRIAVIPAGEKWQDDSLRPSFEDLIGAGAVMSHLEGRFSPEAQLAIEAYQGVRPSLKQLIKQCGSGQELIERGFEQDVDLASEVDVSGCIPRLSDGAYINHAR